VGLAGGGGGSGRVGSLGSGGSFTGGRRGRGLGILTGSTLSGCVVDGSGTGNVVAACTIKFTLCNLCIAIGIGMLCLDSKQSLVRSGLVVASPKLP
jgi:hypothetical protein